jgi:hypothetical protein
LVPSAPRPRRRTKDGPALPGPALLNEVFADGQGTALTVEEVAALVLAYTTGAGLDDPREVDQETIHELAHWAFGARLMAAMVDLLISGQAVVRRNAHPTGGAWEFKRLVPLPDEPVN